MKEFWDQISSFLSPDLTVLITAMLPIIEMRGAIPIGISLGMSPTRAALMAFTGSMLPVPIILFAIRPVFDRLKKTMTFSRLVYRITNRTINKSGNIKKYGALGLMLFVAIPLPGTGIWSGTLAAALLGMRFKLAFPAILTGNLIAGLLITTFSNSMINIIS